ncbi:MAG: hypothetical protein ACLURV_10655 [Gallintestinimicrobium sp.]
MKKLLVLFPGVGYSTARPLLYYAKRIGQEKGYEVLELEYDGCRSIRLIIELPKQFAPAQKHGGTCGLGKI